MKALLLALTLMGALPVPAAAAPAPSPPPREETLRHYLAGRWLERSGDREGALAEYSRALTASPNDAGLLLRLAELATHDGQPLRAVEYTDRVLAADSASARALWLRGAALFQLRRADEALTSLEHAAANAPDDPEILRTLARVAESQSRTGIVAGVFERLTAIDPEDGEAWFQRASSEARLGRFALADSLLERSLALEPERPGARFVRAWVRENLGRLDEALEDYAAHLQTHPQDEPTRRRVVLLLARAGRLPEALVRAREVAAASPRDAEALHVLADLAYSQGRAREGTEVLARMRATAPADPLLVARSLTVMARHGRRREGLALADAWMKAHPRDPEARLLAARAHASFEDAEGAVRLASAAVELAPASLPAARLLARLLEDAGRTAEAGARLRLTRERWPAELGPLFDLGAFHERRGDMDAAVAAGRDALAIAPADASAQNFLGYMLADAGRDLEEAHALIRRALEAEPDNGAYVDSLGWVLFRLGRLEEARRQLERALELTGGDPVIHEHLGDVFAALRLAEQAREQYRLSLSADEANPRVQGKLRGLR